MTRQWTATLPWRGGPVRRARVTGPVGPRWIRVWRESHPSPLVVPAGLGTGPGEQGVPRSGARGLQSESPTANPSHPWRVHAAVRQSPRQERWGGAGCRHGRLAIASGWRRFQVGDSPASERVRVQSRGGASAGRGIRDESRVRGSAARARGCIRCERHHGMGRKSMSALSSRRTPYTGDWIVGRLGPVRRESLISTQSSSARAALLSPLHS